MYSKFHSPCRPAGLSLAFIAAAFLSACLGLGEDDPKTVDVRYKGMLSTLDSIPDTTTQVKRWHMVVDAAEPHQLRGACDYTAWLGDSAGVEAEGTEGLYTNTQMTNSALPAATIRRDGIDFYLYPEHAQDKVLNYYRVDFSCRY